MPWLFANCWGLAKHYCRDSESVFAGKKHGKGVVYYNKEETSLYEGEWGNDLKAILDTANHSALDDRTCIHGVSDSQCYRLSQHGYGRIVYKSGNWYEGEWTDNLKNGQGTMGSNKCIGSASVSEALGGKGLGWRALGPTN